MKFITHKHEFVKIKKVSRSMLGSNETDDKGVVINCITGVEVVCVHCGHGRRVWSDGIVDVTVQSKGLVVDQDPDNLEIGKVNTYI